MSNRITPLIQEKNVPPIARDNFVSGEDSLLIGETPLSNVNIMHHIHDEIITPRGPVSARNGASVASGAHASAHGDLSARSNYSYKETTQLLNSKQKSDSPRSISNQSFSSEEQLSRKSSSKSLKNALNSNIIPNHQQVMASNSIEIQSEKYIPLKFAQERIKKILADWTNMKLEYLKNLQRIELQYKTAEEEDREYMKNFVKSYAKKYKSVKAKLKSNISIKDLQIKTLVTQIEALQSGSNLPAINTEEILKQAKIDEPIVEDQDDLFPTNLFDRRKFVTAEVQTAPVKLSDLKVVGSELDPELKEANDILNEEVARLKANLTDMADYYESQIKEKDLELEELSGQIADLESFKKKIMDLEGDSLTIKKIQKGKSSRDVRMEKESKMIDDIKAEVSRKDQEHEQEVLNLTSTIKSLRSQIQQLALGENDDAEDLITPRDDAFEDGVEITVDVPTSEPFISDPIAEPQIIESVTTEPLNTEPVTTESLTVPEVSKPATSDDTIASEPLSIQLEPIAKLESSVELKSGELSIFDPKSLLERGLSTSSISGADLPISPTNRNSEFNSELEKRLQQVKKKLKDVTNQKSVLLDSIENYKSELLAKEEKLKEQKAEIEKSQSLILELKQKLVDAESDIASKDETIAELESRLSLQATSNEGAAEAKIELKRVQALLLVKEQEASSAQKKMSTLQQKLDSSQQECEKLDQKYKKLTQDSEAAIQQLNTQQQEMQEQMKIAMEKKIERAIGKKNKELEIIKKENETIKSKIGKLAKEVERIQKEKETLQEEILRLEKVAETSNETITTLQSQVDEGLQYKDDCEKAQKQLATFTKKYDEMATQLHTAEDKNRKLFNQIEDMKGKIRVYARVRPFSSVETDKEIHKNVVEAIDDYTVKLIPKDRTFKFSRIFGVDSTQEEVFSDTKDLIQTSLDGYNVCIFAYGQTGTGKTWTITGKPGQEEGLLPRAIRQVFAVAEKKSHTYDITLECQMVELYLDDLVDLLSAEKNKHKSRVTPSGKSHKLEVKKDSNGSVVITNSVIIHCDTPDKMLEVYRAGEKNRHQRATGMNPDSSRSHLVFTVHISATNKKSGDVLQGKLSLVDLAGSESQKKTGLTDATALDEAKAINMSLLHLGEAINCLSTGKRPNYRNSMLTQLLSDSLGGTAKTCMFVCIGPSLYNLETSLRTLEYAERAKKIQNDVSKKVESSKLAGMKKSVQSLGEALRFAVENGGKLPEGLSLAAILDESQEISHV